MPGHQTERAVSHAQDMDVIGIMSTGLEGLQSKKGLMHVILSDQRSAQTSFETYPVFLNAALRLQPLMASFKPTTSEFV